MGRGNGEELAGSNLSPVLERGTGGTRGDQPWVTQSGMSLSKAASETTPQG